jgi:hypothetical protein
MAWLLTAWLVMHNLVVEAADNSTASGVPGSNSTTTAKPSNATSSAAKSTTSAAAKKKPTPPAYSLENWRLARSIVWTWIVLGVGMMIFLFFIKLSRHVRTVSCLTNDTQKYFNEPPRLWGLVKKHLIDAPLFRKRHHREFRITKRIDGGTLPSRMQTLFVVSYLTMVVVLSVINIDYSLPFVKLSVLLMKRTGLMAIVNMLPLFLMAGRNNPLILWTGITFDTYNLIHRWIGRAVGSLCIAHTIIYLVKKVHYQGKRKFFFITTMPLF